MMREGKEEKGQSGGKQRVTQIKGKDNILAVAKRRNPNEGPADAGAVEKVGARHGDSGISIPPAMRPESARKCLVSMGINGRRVNVREFKASSSLDHSI